MSKIIRIRNINIKISDTRQEMGVCAVIDIIEAINEVLKEKEECNIIFAAAPSQNEVLQHLATCTCVDWSRINAFHMDEYIGIKPDAKQAFSNFLHESIFNKISFKTVNCLDCTAQNVEMECARYTELLQKNPVDIVCMGIGENGHIAFNDPHVADFEDPVLVKPVILDEVCRAQQVHDGCFEKLQDVPQKAITLTIPALIRAPRIFCVVPSKTKAKAVKNTLIGKISTDCPASILRNHSNAILYLDADSAYLL